MKTRSKLAVALLAVLLVAASVSGYMWHTNRGPFQDNRVAGLPDGRVRVLDAEPSHMDLLFHRRGGVSFNHFGEGVHVYLAHYLGDELVLHESIASISTQGDWDFNGTVLWGVTIEDLPHELRVHLLVGGAMSRGYFDFSQFDFELGLMAGPSLPSSAIRRGERHILQRWLATGIMPVDDSRVFDPENLRRYGESAFLYVVFR